VWLTFQIKKYFKEISSFTIHKEKSILYALLLFDDKKEISSSVYAYDLTTSTTQQKYKQNKIKSNLTRIAYDTINEHLLISDGDKFCVHILLLPRTNEEKIQTKSFSCKGEGSGGTVGVITHDNYIWIVDSCNDRIQKYSEADHHFDRALYGKSNKRMDV